MRSAPVTRSGSVELVDRIVDEVHRKQDTEGAIREEERVGGVVHLLSGCGRVIFQTHTAIESDRKSEERERYRNPSR
jgi:hypothetical protein